MNCRSMTLIAATLGIVAVPADFLPLTVAQGVKYSSGQNDILHKSTMAIDLAPLSDALNMNESVASLEKEASQKLRERIVQFFSVWNQTTADEYDALLQSWGGVSRLDMKSPRTAQIRSDFWSAAGADCSIREFLTDQIQCDLIVGFEEGGQVVTPWPAAATSRIVQKNGRGAVYFCSYEFGAGLAALARQGEPVFEMVIPVEMSDGDSVMLAMRWIWEPGTQNWVPWLMHQETESKAVCGAYF